MNPYRTEGNRTIAFKIAEDIHSIPDWVALLSVEGGLLSGIAKDFEELGEGKVISKLPKKLAV